VLVKGAVSKTSVYDRQIGVIEEVEGLSAHLKIHIFAELNSSASPNQSFHAWAQDVSNLTTSKVSLAVAKESVVTLGLSLGSEL